jgi:endonuclease/exonuclease/phosphatase family metal-dependent hydrolase
MRWLQIPLILITLLVVYLSLAGCMTLSDKTIPVTRIEAASPPPPAASPVRLMSWNIGYAGLGEESDFKADGGKMLQPPGKAVVEKNLAGIQSVLRAEAPDVLMMQEVAGPGFLTRGVDVASGVKEALPAHSMFFSSDIRTRLLPRFLSLRHGLATFVKVAAGGTEIVRITEEPGTIMGFIKRRYHVQVTEFEAGGQPWAIVNVHLSAFDEGANTRMAQLREVLDLGQSLYQQGKAVAIGGDWNMRLAPTDFAYTADDAAQFWIHDFPREELRPGWQVVIDPAVPSVRTNEQPYTAGVNYTTIIDGFVVSPNVQVESVRGVDLGFAITDHQPVIATLSRTDAPAPAPSDATPP